MKSSEDEKEIPAKSKTQVKKDMAALQKLGESLIALSTQQLAKVPMSNRLREAVIAAKQITSRGAAQRQRQYIGRLMRHEDAQTIAQAVAALRPSP